ncbi:hypothetical protein FZC66_02125 [Priestia megaterium]|nr:hypothetical protein FZC66_02125 [Priestia megaterium]
MDTLFQTNIDVTEEQNIEFKELVTKIGVWINQKFFWVNDLYTSSPNMVASYPLAVQLEVYKGKVEECNICCVKLTIKNLAIISKSLKVYFQQETAVKIDDHVAYYGPNEQSLVHWLNDRIYICNGKYKGKGIKQYTTKSGKQRRTPHLWSNLRKGHLLYRPISAKDVMSAITLEETIGPHKRADIYYWIIQSKQKGQAEKLNRLLQKTDWNSKLKSDIILKSDLCL